MTKGDEFEFKSLNIIKKVIEEEQLGHLSKYIKIYTKNDKGYYSERRKKEIYFDITIEVWPPNAARYSLIYIIECKNYDKRVPVDDIEEFHSKIQQVSGVNVKGIFITNSPLQESAYNVAESLGMMVVQGESSENYNIILHKSNVRNVSNIPFVISTKETILLDEGVNLIEKLIDDKINNIFIPVFKEKFVSYNIDKLSKKDIEDIATNIINMIDPEVISQGRSMSVSKLIKYLEKHEKLSIIEDNSNSQLLGWCDIKKMKIGINSKIRNTDRELFVLAHEYGHFILHQKLIIEQHEYNNFSDPEYNFKTGKYDLTNPKNWIEWQANYFASSLITHKVQFIARLWWCQQRLSMGQGVIYLDDQYSNRKLFAELIKKMAYILNISKSTVIYRLNDLELINDKSNTKSIGQIVSENKTEFII